MKAVSIGKIAIMLGVCTMTIRRWQKDGKLTPDFTTMGGHRRYDISRVKKIFEPIKNDRVAIGYCRVSSSDQLGDLATQRQIIETELSKKANWAIICDKGSGINFKKRGLLNLIHRIMKDEVSEVIITHKDRLVRFGYELLEQIAFRFGTKISILMQEEKTPTFEEELARDLITIITVFSSKLYGKRSHKNKKLILLKSTC